MAIVPQPLAPKSYAKVQSLIDEGVADAKTFDQYMLSLTQKKGEQSVSMAQAQDKAAVDLNIQTRKEAAAEKDRQFQAQRDKVRMAFDAEQNGLDRQAKVAAAGAKDSTTTGKKKELENWQRVAADAFYESNRTSTANTVDNATGLSTKTTTTYQTSPSNNDLANAYAQAENFANQLGITLNQQNVNDVVALKKLIGKTYTSGKGATQTVDNAFIQKVVTNGLGKGNTLTAIVKNLEKLVR
jgi:hypothetical protein